MCSGNGRVTHITRLPIGPMLLQKLWEDGPHESVNNFAVSTTMQHHSDVIMSMMTSPTIGVSMVYSTICSGADHRKRQRSVPLAFVRGSHRWPVNSPHKGPVTWKNVFILWRHHDAYILHGIRCILCLCGHVACHMPFAHYFLISIRNGII